MTAPIEIAEPYPVRPAHLLVAAGLSVGAFENLNVPFQEELVRLRLLDAAEAVELAEKTLAEHRATFRALVELRDYMTDPDPERTLYRVLEAN